MPITFGDFLSRLKKAIPLLGSAVTLILGLLALDKIIPEPIYSFKTFGTIIVVLALIATYYFINYVISKFKYVLIITFSLLMLLLIVHSLFVVRVDYDGYYANYLIGTSICDPDLKKWESNAEIIRVVGGEMEHLRNSYCNYSLILFLYSLLSICFIFFLTFCLGGVLQINTQNSSIDVPHDGDQ